MSVRQSKLRADRANLSRRHAIKMLGLSGAAALSPVGAWAAEPRREKLPVAGVVTEYRKNSHADVILGKILAGWRQAGAVGPDLELVSLYTDQVPENDLSRQLAARHGVAIAKTIDEAVTLGGDKVPVAAVLSIGEHGDYPLTEVTQQKQYPRRTFFDEIIAAMQRCGQFVPVFNDKHLGYAWQDALHMVTMGRKHNVPLMAGSSLPVAWRYPAKQLPIGCQIEEALVISYGPLESYGFHALESLQCIVERRRGGETGVAAVTALKGAKIWAAERRREWSRELLDAAVQSFLGTSDDLERRMNVEQSAVYRVEYRDGLQGTVAMLNGVEKQFAVACRLRGQADPVAFWIRLEEQAPYGHFEHLLRGIEHMVHTGKPAYPVERTLLTTGILDRAMHSLARAGQRLLTPELDVRYQPSPWGFANLEQENFPS